MSDSPRYITRVKTVVNSYSLQRDDDLFIEEDFEESVNEAIEDVESLIDEVEVMDITFTNLVEGDTLIKVADIEFGANEEQWKQQNSNLPPKLGTGSKKVTEEVFDYIHAQSRAGLGSKEICKLFEDNGQKVSDFTVRKVLQTEFFEDYYAN